ISQILKESEQSVEENIYSSEEVSNEELAKEDEFLKTFTTSVEEVFLDQPTAMISDYVPPNTDGAEHAAPAAAGNNVKREKPSDIKTVPLVPDTLGQEIHSSPYVESGTSKFRKSGLVNAIKWMLVILLIVALTVMALSGLAVMNVIDEKFSPIHTVIYSLQKTPQENETQSEEDLEPEIITQKTPENEMQVSNNEQDQVYTVLEKVKNYTFSDATTLESRINNIHKNSSSNIEWSLIPIEEQNVYSIAVKIPQNTDGQGFSYRFNYDVPGNVLTPTTSEAKNIMENYSK
ncbi:MAG: hypothetical protein J6S61_03090, partial [Elusimicrobiaceae bacterium]|nr:hypothetical protein [Elusimicrobiaceae bacterium]